MATTTLAAALSASATSITVPVDEALGLFPAPQFGAWIGTEQVTVVAGPPDAAWTILRDQSVGGGALFTDTFDRDEEEGWGNGWGRGGGGSAIAVAGGVGTITPVINGGRQPYQSALTVLDSEVRFRFWGDVVATGAEFEVHAVFRDNAANIGSASYYRMDCSVRASDQLMRLRGQATIIGGTPTSLGGVPTTTGLTFVVGTVYWLAARCSGVSPTTLEMKVWVDGETEPAAWTRVDTDSALGPQVAGYPGARAGINSGWTAGALTVSFDDYSVLRIPVGTAWDLGTVVQSIDSVDAASLIPVGDGPPISQPPDGARYLDRLNNRLYVRTIGVWRYTVLT